MNREYERKLYDKIRKENTEKYGTKVSNYGPVLLEQQYRDRTHFIYELIQNTEDACERATNDREEDFYLFFNLYPDRLELFHNGIPFTEDDIRGICGIVQSTKSGDYSQIGKFGIGFKSVYAYTKSPEIYSCNNKDGSYYFKINDYVHPYAIDHIKEHHNNNETKIVIPFNRNDVPASTAYNEIQQRLEKLGNKTTLFLKNISEISWKIDNRRGRYYKNDKQGEHFRWIELLTRDPYNKQEEENWLVFSQPLSAVEKNAKVEIAYKIEIDENNNKQIVPAPFSELFVYFSTRKETHLNFIVQGPYQTTLGRDNIRKTQWNEELIQKTKELLISSLDHVKRLGLLNVSFLQTLPIDTEYFTGEDDSGEIIFKDLYFAIKNAFLSETPYLPKLDSGFVSASTAILGRTREIRDLLSIDQLTNIYGEERSSWLDERITIDRTPELRTYLMSELMIPEMTADMFARFFSLQFIVNQSDEWITKLYRYLANQPALWRAENYRFREGPLRSKPFLRLKDETHVAPFDKDKKPNAFLPLDGYEEHFPMIKSEFCSNGEITKFFIDLGLREPNQLAAIERYVLPKYVKSPIQVSEEENITDIKWIFTTINNLDSRNEQKKFIDKIKNFTLLYAKNGTEKAEYKTPISIYLGYEYSGTNDAEIFFAGNEEIWFLDDRYNELDSSYFLQIGCSKEIKIQYKRPDHSGYVNVIRSGGWHVRGLNRFDPNLSIEGLSFVLETISFEKSLIIWNLLKKYSHSIYGEIETSTNQNFTAPKKESKPSRAGKLLMFQEWVPDKNGIFNSPNELMVSELPHEFDPNSVLSIDIANKLQFKTDTASKLLEYAPEDRRPTISACLGLTDDENEAVLNFINKVKAARFQDEEQTLEDILNETLEDLGSGQVEDIIEPSDPGAWTGLTYEEEKEYAEKYSEALPTRWKELETHYKTKTTTDRVIIDTINPKEFLLAKYRGHCQICNKYLYAGKSRPIFSVFRLVKKRKHPSANMEWNILGLCPNCHALLTYSLKYNTGSLSNIFLFAETVARNDIAPEPVRERGGDHYIVDILLAGKEVELFYTQDHMRAFVSFFIDKAELNEKDLERRTGSVLGNYRKNLRGE